MPKPSTSGTVSKDESWLKISGPNRSSQSSSASSPDAPGAMAQNDVSEGPSPRRLLTSSVLPLPPRRSPPSRVPDCHHAGMRSRTSSGRVRGSPNTSHSVL